MNVCGATIGSLEFQLSGVPCTVLRAAPVIAARQQLAETRFRGAGAGQIASACRTFWVVRLARVSEEDVLFFFSYILFAFRVLTQSD